MERCSSGKGGNEKRRHTKCLWCPKGQSRLGDGKIIYWVQVILVWLLQEESCWQGDHLRTSETMWRDGDRSQQAWKSGAKQEVEMADLEEAQEMGDLGMMGSSGLQHPFSYKYPGQKTGCSSAPPQPPHGCPKTALPIYCIFSPYSLTLTPLPPNFPDVHLTF